MLDVAGYWLALCCSEGWIILLFLRKDCAKAMLRRIGAAVLVLLLPVVSGGSTLVKNPHSGSLEQREAQVANTLRRAAQYVDVPHISSRRTCAAVEAPQALTTPDPLFTTAANRGKVKVSFIIGTDGRVHSPLILESAGVAGDRRVLQTVRTWRYRPATCNGVPTETEGKVEFSNQ
jgi:TonB family protein